MNRFLSFFFLVIILFVSVVEVLPQWKQINLGPIAGKINTIEVNGSNILAGTNSGINRSTNYGATWERVNDKLTLCFAAIGSNVFAGTGNGVIISSDFGNNWTIPNDSMSYYITALAIKDTVIFAGTMQNGIFRSINKGISWKAVDSGLGNFQNMINALALNGNMVFAGTAAGLCVSTNNGNNWITLEGNNLYANTYINCIATNGATVFAGTPSNILRSTDNGNTWETAYTGLNNGTSIFSFLLNNPNVFAGTTAGVYMSTDNGNDWTSVSNGLPVSPSQVYSVASGPSSDGGTNLYAATNSGVYLSTDNGTSWTAENNGSVGTEVYSITGNDSKIFAVIKGSSIYVSTDYGTTWKAAADSGFNSTSIPRLMATNNGLYAATYDNGIYYSLNDGDSWKLINGGVLDTVRPLSIIQSGQNLVVSTYSNGIYYSSNNGDSWDTAKGNLPREESVLSNIDSGIFAEFGDRMYYSSDYGENWTLLNNFQFNGLSYHIGIVSSGSTLFTAREPAVQVDTVVPPASGLYYSSDNGKTWLSFYSNSLPIGGAYIYSLFSYNSYILVAAEDALFVSSNSINKWNMLGEPLGSSISSIFVNDSSVFVGTYQGIWQIPLSNIVSKVNQQTLPTVPRMFKLLQNYPNPFNPSTTIGYEIPKFSHVFINVYDILGRKVETLVDAERLPGRYEITLDASKFASGIYFYQLRAGNFVTTKKMLLLK